MNKKPIYFKYMLSSSVLLLFINLLIIYFSHDVTQVPVWANVVVSILWSGACVLTVLYWVHKFKLMRTNTFSFSKQDYKFAYYALSAYSGELILGGLFIIISNVISSITVLFWTILILLVIISIIGSVCELCSRIQYQMYLNQQAYNQYSAQQDVDVQNTMHEYGIDKQAAEIISSQQHRTKDAKDLIKKDLDQHNPFMDEE